MTDIAAPTDRTYGGWRKPATVGIGGLGLAGTIVLFAGLIAAIIALAAGGILYAIPIVILTALPLGPMLIHDRNGRTGIQWVTARAAWGQGRMAGANLYRAGPLAVQGHGRCTLPGLGAQLEALEAQDALGRPFCLLSHPTVGHVSVVISTSPTGAALVDESQVDAWVGHWAAWLAALSHDPALLAAQVTVEAAPDDGHRLRAEVNGRMAVGAPDVARGILDEVLATYPAFGASITSCVALTWSLVPGAGMKRRTVEEMAIEVGHKLPGLTASLSATGAGPSRPMTVAEVAGMVRSAYDPAVRPAVEQLGQDDPVEWSDAGPIGAEERWDQYRHDSGTSITWAMSEAPRGLVFASVLSRVLAPSPACPVKRVSLVFRPHSPATAAKVVESDKRNALFRTQSHKVGRAADDVELVAATQAAAEEARGASVIRISMTVTATVTDPDGLPAAAAAVESLAGSSRIRVRRMHGSQATGFLAGLPLGMVLANHLKVPAIVREAL